MAEQNCSGVDFTPPDFRPSRWFPGGHLQTLGSLRAPPTDLAADRKHTVDLPDGDAIVLHENEPANGPANHSGRSLVLFHGLSGCHGSPYMIRFAERFRHLGFRVFRVDMRGCGDARDLCDGIAHAGRSNDVRAAMSFVADLAGGEDLNAIGVSLGGNQLLRFCGRVGGGLDERPSWWGRAKRVAAVAPPIDLVRCSRNMNRKVRRLYNRYFIRALLRRAPRRVQDRAEFKRVVDSVIPRTLYELDDRLTAPLSGFSGADEYYTDSGACSVVKHINLPTLVLAAANDPIVPASCFDREDWSDVTKVVVKRSGGHAGFIGTGRTHWMDECMESWINC
ncbi:MAG: alpha/beta fold hydrolase [Planctomycetota bacterium]